MSTTKAKRLKEIKDKLGLLPGRIYCTRDVGLCIDGLYEALVGLLEFVQEQDARYRFDHELMKIILDDFADSDFFRHEFKRWKQKAMKEVFLTEGEEAN